MDNIAIYGLAHPRTHQVRYVGKSKNVRRRYSEHLSVTRKGDKSFHLYHWLRKLQRQGLKPELVILETVMKEEWTEKERYWIAHYGLENLCNMNEGGVEPPDTTGRKKTVEERAKISRARRGKSIWSKERPHPALGKPSPLRGRKMSLDFRKRASVAKMGDKNPMYGKHFSKEALALRKQKVAIRVHLLDENDAVLKTYDSFTDAGKDLGLPSGAVSRVCSGEYKQTHGYKFRYADMLSLRLYQWQLDIGRQGVDLSRLWYVPR